MVKRKKRYMGIGLVLIVCIIVCLSYMYWSKKTNATKYFTSDPSGITRIEIRSGSDGESRVITDKDDRKKITDILSRATFNRASKGKDATGWLYNMDIYEGDNIVFNFYDGCHQMIFDDYYDMSQPERDEMITLVQQLLDKYKGK